MSPSSARENLLQKTAGAIEASEERCDAADTSIERTVAIVRLSQETIVTSMDRLARINRRRGTVDKS
jgi:hypothetical protein